MRRGAKALLILGVSIPAALFDDGRLFLFVPVLINAALLVAFGRTLVNGPSMVETFARLRGRNLSTEEVVYCRIVTGVWCPFLALNGAVTLWLALYASLAWWTLYTGVLSYVLIATLPRDLPSSKKRMNRPPVSPALSPPPPHHRAIRSVIRRPSSLSATPSS